MGGGRREMVETAGGSICVRFVYNNNWITQDVKAA